MYLTQFPNIDWLRATAKADFANQKNHLGTNLEGKGWPNVILNTTSTGVERDEIKGPFSLFTNISGKSSVRVNKKWLSIDHHTFCLSNPGELYDLHVNESESTELFNIHFGNELFEDVISNALSSTEFLLDNPIEFQSSFEILPKLSLKDKMISQHLMLIKGLQKVGDQTMEYEYLGALLVQIIKTQKTRLAGLQEISSCKASTRKELFARLSVAIDYMHQNLSRPINLDEISRNCGLSKFHFIRVFKEAYGTSPNGYFAKLKFEKAKELLFDSKKHFTEISNQLGFSEPSAFTRFFKNHSSLSPSVYRSQLTNS